MSYRYRYTEAFEDDFYFVDWHLMHWIEERCMHRDGYDDWGGLKTLERDFYDWCVKSRTPIPQAVYFPQGLEHRGYRIENGMVSGLFLKEDAWALEAR